MFLHRLRFFRPRSAALSSLVILAVAAAACGTPAPPVKTGTGVSNTAIRLGVLSDLSGPFGPLGEAVVQGNQLYVDKLNAAGGVCGRKVELDVQDTGFDTDKAVQLYFRMEPTVLGLLQVVGSDITSKITPDMLQQQVMAAPTSWSSDLLGNPYMVVVGATYDLDVINSFDYLVRQGMLHQGDVIGHIYNDDPEYGGNALLGSQFVADKLGLQLKAVQVAATKTDFTAEIAQLKAAGAKAIAISTYPQQTAVAVGTAAAVGLNVPFLVSNPGFDPSVLASPVGPAFQQLVLVSSSVAPFGAKLPAAEELATAYKAKFPNGKPSMAVDYGYVVGIGYGAILKRACEEGDLTRPGVQKAFHELTGVDTGGLTAPLLFSSSNYPSSRQSFVLRPNPKTVGGLDIVDPLKESDLVRQRIG